MSKWDILWYTTERHMANNTCYLKQLHLMMLHFSTGSRERRRLDCSGHPSRTRSVPQSGLSGGGLGRHTASSLVSRTKTCVFGCGSACLTWPSCSSAPRDTTVTAIWRLCWRQWRTVCWARSISLPRGSSFQNLRWAPREGLWMVWVHHRGLAGLWGSDQAPGQLPGPRNPYPAHGGPQESGVEDTGVSEGWGDYPAVCRHLPWAVRVWLAPQHQCGDGWGGGCHSSRQTQAWCQAASQVCREETWWLQVWGEMHWVWEKGSMGMGLRIVGRKAVLPGTSPVIDATRAGGCSWDWPTTSGYRACGWGVGGCGWPVWLHGGHRYG